MIDVKNKKCQENDCEKSPIYNFKGEKKVIYCVLHKKEGMININNKKCQEKECEKQPN
jgi:hypothetical protein